MVGQGRGKGEAGGLTDFRKRGEGGEVEQRKVGGGVVGVRAGKGWSRGWGGAWVE